MREAEVEAKIMKQVDETAFALRLDLAREKKLREEAEERHEKEVADEIVSDPKLFAKALPPHARALHQMPPVVSSA